MKDEYEDDLSESEKMVEILRMYTFFPILTWCLTLPMLMLHTCVCAHFFDSIVLDSASEAAKYVTSKKQNKLWFTAAKKQP